MLEQTSPSYGGLKLGLFVTKRGLFAQFQRTAFGKSSQPARQTDRQTDIHTYIHNGTLYYIFIENSPGTDFLGNVSCLGLFTVMIRIHSRPVKSYFETVSSAKEEPDKPKEVWYKRGVITKADNETGLFRSEIQNFPGNLRNNLF